MDDKEISILLRKSIDVDIKKSVVINIIINAIVGYVVLKGVDIEDKWGFKDYAQDLMLTGFILCSIVSVIYISMYRKGNIEVGLSGREGSPASRLLPYRPWFAALALGGLGAAIAVPPILLFLMLFGFESVTPVLYAVFKGVWAGVVAGVVVPISINQGLRRSGGND